MTAPAMFVWQGDSFAPLSRFAKQCDREFVIGERYRLAEVQDHSDRSRNHYFATIKDGWDNLPEHQAERFASAEHLRKWCLIKAGYRDERSIVTASKAEAMRIAAFVRPMDEFAVVVVKEATVIVATAKSQSKRAMGAADFQKSKEAVLEIIAEMVGVSPAALQCAEAA